MSDGGSITPPVLNQIQTTGNSAQGTITVKLLDIPDALLSGRQPPSTLTGKILQHLSEQNTVIATPHGKVTIQTTQPLKIPVGETVHLTLNTTNSPPNHASLEINKTPPPPQQREAATTVQTYTTYKPDISSNQLLQSQSKHPVLPTNAPDIQTLIPNKQNVSYTRLNTIESKPVLNAPPPDTSTAEPRIAKVSTPDIITGKVSTESRKSIPAPPLQNHASLQNKVPDPFVPTTTKTLPHTTPDRASANIPNNQATVITAPTPTRPKQPITTQSNNATTPTRHNITHIQITRIEITPAKPFLPPAPTNTTQPPQIPEGRAGEVRATVIGFTKEQNFPVLRIGAPTVQSPSPSHKNHITLQHSVRDLPVGARVTFTPTVRTQSPLQTASPQHITPAITAITSQHSAFFLTPENWPIMAELEQSLHQATPQLAHNFHAIIPNPSTPAQMNAASLFFLAAVRAGDVQGWIGEKAQNALKDIGKSEILNRLGNEFSSMMRLSNEPVSQEWKSLPLPIAWQDEIQKIVLHYRRENTPDNEDSIQNAGNTRFVMDLNLSQIGDIQIDGLFRDATQNEKKLDLIIRSEEHFSKAMQTQMKDLYTNAMENTGLIGSLSFQQKSEQWVNIAYDAPPEYEQSV